MKLCAITILTLFVLASPLEAQLEANIGKVAGFAVDNWYELNIDESVLQRLSEIVPQKDDGFQFAFPLKVNLNPENSGFLRKTENEIVWTIGIRSKSAKSLNLILEPFKIPAGSYIYIYNNDRSVIHGAFGSNNNNPDGILPTIPVPGEELILEYHIPTGLEWKGTLGISQVAHDYRGIFGSYAKDSRYNMSQSCNIDINCEAGNGYSMEKRAVCRLIIGGTELCSGFLVNNTNQQNRPLLITAQHCIASENDAARSIFVFGYESPWCSGPDGRVSHSISGATLRSTNETVDFTLVELSSFPPFTYRPYLAGWNVTGTIPQNTFTIHHPEGDVKKITVDQNSPVTSSFLQYASNAFWKVLQWEQGTTEGGSSGAPLFDQDKRVVGFLTGGDAVCGRSVNDFFAKLSVVYDYSKLLYQQLQGWIDPAKTGLKTFAGRDPYSGNLLTLDTLNNILTGETVQVIKYTPSGNSYATGYNTDSLVMYAEYFRNTVSTEVSEVLINIAKAISVSSADSARVYILADGSVPGQIIASRKIFLYEAKDLYSFRVDFVKTIPVSGNFYIGWRIWYKEKAASETRQLAVFHSPDRGNPSLNSAWFNNGSGWQKFTAHPSYPMSIALDVKVVTIGNSVVNNIKTSSQAENSFKVYPNPVNSILKISSGLNYPETYLEIYDSKGSLLRSQKISDGFPGEINIDLDGFYNGVYFLVINSGNICEYHKFVISR